MAINKRFVSISLASALVIAACGGGTSSSPGASGAPVSSGDTSGTIVISGSSTVEPLSTRVKDLYNEQHPDVAISVDGPGTGDGFALFCAGETDIRDRKSVV